MAKTALITGATAGIGAAFARRLAGEGYDLVLVARDQSRLASFGAELAGSYRVSVAPLGADLATDEGCARVQERLAGSDPPVDLLVNNAGMSLNKPFLRSTPDREELLLRLNVHAVMRLTRAALPAMVERRGGDIVNVSSVAGFGTPMPGSTYSASKAWVTNFTESIALSVRGYGVRMMALCPGYTRTEFHDRAEIDMSKIPSRLWLRADDVVRDGLADLRSGKIVSVPDWKYKIAVFGMRHLPHRALRTVTKDTRGVV
jgi:short-subunit dehydrogenase